MAKPKPNVPAKARPLNLVARSLWREKNSAQNFGYLVNPGIADDRIGDEIASRNSLQTASKSEVGYSQVSRQENVLIAEGNLCMKQLQKQCNQRALSDSHSSGQLLQGATLRQEFQNMKYTNHQYMTKIFQFLQKKVEVTAGYSTFSMEAFFSTKKCVDMAYVHVLVDQSSRSSWTELFCKPGGLQEHELQGD